MVRWSEETTTASSKCTYVSCSLFTTMFGVRMRFVARSRVQ
jgi:hypothetical protein